MLQKSVFFVFFLFKQHKNGVISTNLWAKCGWQSVPIPLRYHSDVHRWLFGEKNLFYFEPVKFLQLCSTSNNGICSSKNSRAFLEYRL